jgi:glycosyltransferase involved in cell wall biosynthesis
MNASIAFDRSVDYGKRAPEIFATGLELIMRYPRIAMIHSSMGERGGAEKLILEQANYLTKRHSLTIFATYSRPQQCYPNLMKGLDIRQLVGFPIPKFELVSNITLALILARNFKGNFEEYDILFTHQQPAHWIAYTSSRPYVVQIHSLLTILYPERFPDEPPWDTDYDRFLINLASKLGGYRILRHVDRLSMRGARKVLVQSKKLAKVIKDLYDVEAFCIHYGIDFSGLTRTNPEPVFSKYRIKSPLILMVTRLIPSKGADVLIEIMPRILREYPKATLVIACPKGHYQTVWRLHARRLNVENSTRIITVPPSEINALYSGATVVGFPSIAPENAPRAVIEAMSFGIPIVAWDNGWGGAETVAEGGGMLAKPHDINDFGDKVQALLNDEEMRIRIGKRTRQYAATLSWEHVGPKFEEVLRNAAG